MAIYFTHVSQWEKQYPFEDAIAGADTINGAFGEVENGEFKVAANATKAIIQKENGDNVGLDIYPIAKGEHVRVVDVTQNNGKPFQIYGAQLPDTYEEGDKLVSDAEGKLVTGATSAPYFKITKIIPNVNGVEVVAVTESTESATE